MKKFLFKHRYNIIAIVSIILMIGSVSYCKHLLEKAASENLQKHHEQRQNMKQQIEKIEKVKPKTVNRKTVVKSQWKPKPRKFISAEHNNYLFAIEGMDHVFSEEIGSNYKKKPFCHNPDIKKDPGGMTCGGFAQRRRPDFYMKVLNHLADLCLNNPIGMYYPIAGDTYITNPYGTIIDLCYFFKKEYWDTYVHIFKECPYNAMMVLGDTSINAGPYRAIVILQQSHGIKVDGLWGPQSEKACNNFDKEKYLKRRMVFYTKTKNYEYNKNGWSNRLKRLSKRY